MSQVAPSASEQELKTAYKKGALKHHPGNLISPLQALRRRQVLTSVKIRTLPTLMPPTSSRTSLTPTKLYRTPRSVNYMISTAKKDSKVVVVLVE